MIECSFELSEEELSVTTLIEAGLQKVFWDPRLASFEGRDWGFNPGGRYSLIWAI